MSYVQESLQERKSSWVSALQGRFTRDVIAMGDPAWVAVNAWANNEIEEIEWGPCLWSPQWGSQNIPKRGDLALLILDDQRTPWILSWVPATYIPDGIGGSSIRYVFNQLTPSSTWNIIHNLGAFPSVTIVDEVGVQIYTQTTYLDSNRITINFDVPQVGKAYLV